MYNLAEGRMDDGIYIYVTYIQTYIHIQTRMPVYACIHVCLCKKCL